MLDQTSNKNLTLPTAAKQGDILKILVENQGRSYNGYLPKNDWKGLHDNITLDNVLLLDWYACGINLTKESIDSLAGSLLESHLDESNKAVSQPGVYVGTLTVNDIQDTFFDSTGWGKGQLFINGYNLGRYWPNKGPQVKSVSSQE